MIYKNQNVGFLDCMVRGLLGIDLLALCFMTWLNGPMLLFACLGAGYLICTSLTSFCPLYTATGLNTRYRTDP
jgi:hypothetical protein